MASGYLSLQLDCIYQAHNLSALLRHNSLHCPCLHGFVEAQDILQRLSGHVDCGLSSPWQVPESPSQLRENARCVITTSLDNLFLPIIRVECNLVQGVQPMSSVVEVLIYTAVIPSKGAVRASISLVATMENSLHGKLTYPVKSLESSTRQPA